MAGWTPILELDSGRTPKSGSVEALRDAIGRGADLRIGTAFRHNEHIDVTSDNPELVQEVPEFRETYLLDGRWAAGFMTLRQPIDLPVGFGPRPSMSFFLYNEDGQQAVARPHLDGPPVSGRLGASPVHQDRSMLKNYFIDNWDAETNAPSHNFIYSFEYFRFFVLDEWREVLSHDSDGGVASGSVDELAEAFVAGSEVKVGIRGLCADLTPEGDPVLEHEVFIHVGSCYYYTEQKLFIGATHPLVRVRPSIPLTYVSQGWDFGWLMVRTDGFAASMLADPYTLRFRRSEQRYAMRWFVR